MINQFKKSKKIGINSILKAKTFKTNESIPINNLPHIDMYVNTLIYLFFSVYNEYIELFQKLLLLVLMSILENTSLFHQI